MVAHTSKHKVHDIFRDVTDPAGAIAAINDVLVCQRTAGCIHEKPYAGTLNIYKDPQSRSDHPRIPT